MNFCISNYWAHYASTVLHEFFLIRNRLTLHTIAQLCVSYSHKYVLRIEIAKGMYECTYIIHSTILQNRSIEKKQTQRLHRFQWLDKTQLFNLQMLIFLLKMKIYIKIVVSIWVTGTMFSLLMNSCLAMRSYQIVGCFRLLSYHVLPYD